MTLGKKLALGFSAISTVAAALGVSAWICVSRMRSDLDHAVHRTARCVELISDIRNSTQTFRFAGRGVLMYASAGDVAEVQKNKALFASSAGAVANKLRDLRALVESAAEQNAAGVIEQGVSEYVEVQAEVGKMCGSGKLRDAIHMQAHRLGPVAAKLNESLQVLLSEQRDANARSAATAEALANNCRTIVILLFAIGVALGAAAGLVTVRTTRDLRGVARQLGDGAQQISGAAAQVASSSQSLAQGASEQAASLEQTSASSAEIGSVTRQNAQNSRAAAESVQAESNLVEEANRHLAEMVTSMDEINASSGKISKIIKVIDEIAFQTNILALNAAVEAARAGEAGMGFAVVADEVRNLAQRCTQAARDTTGLIEESIATSNGGKAKLDLVASAVRSITGGAAKVKTLVEEVNAASEQQAIGIEQVAKAIQQMEKVTQTTAASAEESASASEELSAQSESLKAIAVRLESMVGAAAGVRSYR